MQHQSHLFLGIIFLRKHNKEKLKNKKSSKSKPPSSCKNGCFKKSSGKSTQKEHSTKRKVGSRSKYFTRQSVRNLSEQSSSLDTPSTSTGITSSPKRSLYRIIEQDSDDEPRNSNENNEGDSVEENNFVNILPTPLNGTRDVFINVLEVDNVTRMQR